MFVMCRAMDQHNREVMEMEDLLEQHLSEVHEDHQIRVSQTTPTATPTLCGNTHKGRSIVHTVFVCVCM